MDANKVKIWKNRMRKRKTENKEEEEEKNNDHLPMAGSGKVPVRTPQKPLTDSNAIHWPIPRRKTGFTGL